MAESNADLRAGFSGDVQASSPAAGGAGGPPGPARGWVVVAPAGVPAAALAPLAALLLALGPPRRLLAPSLAAGAALGDPGATSGAEGPAQSSRKSSDSGSAADAAAWSEPQRLLAALAEQPGPWWWPLAGDPGAFLGSQGNWAEALGAWRQPTLLLVPAAAAATGPAAAYHALLQRQGVPLLGLIQWGGPWLAAERRRDGLPWLGWLADPQAPDLDHEHDQDQDQDQNQDDDQDLAEAAAADLARALQLASHHLDLD